MRYTHALLAVSAVAIMAASVAEAQDFCRMTNLSPELQQVQAQLCQTRPTAGEVVPLAAPHVPGTIVIVPPARPAAAPAAGGGVGGGVGGGGGQGGGGQGGGGQGGGGQQQQQQGGGQQQQQPWQAPQIWQNLQQLPQQQQQSVLQQYNQQQQPADQITWSQWQRYTAQEQQQRVGRLDEEERQAVQQAIQQQQQQWHQQAAAAGRVWPPVQQQQQQQSGPHTPPASPGRNSVISVDSHGGGVAQQPAVAASGVRGAGSNARPRPREFEDVIGLPRLRHERPIAEAEDYTGVHHAQSRENIHAAWAQGQAAAQQQQQGARQASPGLVTPPPADRISVDSHAPGRVSVDSHGSGEPAAPPRLVSHSGVAAGVVTPPPTDRDSAVYANVYADVHARLHAALAEGLATAQQRPSLLRTPTPESVTGSGSVADHQPVVGGRSSAFSRVPSPVQHPMTPDHELTGHHVAGGRTSVDSTASDATMIVHHDIDNVGQPLNSPSAVSSPHSQAALVPAHGHTMGHGPAESEVFSFNTPTQKQPQLRPQIAAPRFGTPPAEYVDSPVGVWQPSASVAPAPPTSQALVPYTGRAVVSVEEPLTPTSRDGLFSGAEDFPVPYAEEDSQPSRAASPVVSPLPVSGLGAGSNDMPDMEATPRSPGADSSVSVWQLALPAGNGGDATPPPVALPGRASVDSVAAAQEQEADLARLPQRPGSVASMGEYMPEMPEMPASLFGDGLVTPRSDAGTPQGDVFDGDGADAVDLRVTPPSTPRVEEEFMPSRPVSVDSNSAVAAADAQLADLSSRPIRPGERSQTYDDAVDAVSHMHDFSAQNLASMYNRLKLETENSSLSPSGEGQVDPSVVLARIQGYLNRQGVRPCTEDQDGCENFAGYYNVSHIS